MRASDRHNRKFSNWGIYESLEEVYIVIVVFRLMKKEIIMKKQLNSMQAWYEAKNDGTIELVSYRTLVCTYQKEGDILRLHPHWDCSRTTGRQVTTFCRQILDMPGASVPALRKALVEGDEINGTHIIFDDTRGFFNAGY